ncbi:serine/threonine-protein kinase [Saccharothrix syringae]|uniref:non-specific serine/threonine protein kinase n=1 Tax=Saccharothrix syringae TaxID=103733 RepID=A0A5Q0H718_SACSY|nr:serine/threonine-protein kinase [Saccharothrix syringae]QFZ21959.1 serine/threonine protein kinase [Saccharothrix syringae]
MWDGDLTGEVVDGRYALGTLYGSGGMAEVYRAFDTRLERRVAIKFFPGEASPEDRIRLAREADVLGELHCPGLVEVYDTGVHLGRPYFVMQPVEGGTLRRRMREALEPAEVARIGAQVAQVLAHVHAHGVVHRDVKPSNILLDPGEGRAYLADFGLALQAQVTRVTRSGILVGTAGYLAPEQVRGADVLPAADVYALGLVLLECLTGRPEYPGGDTEAALARLHREPRVPTDLPAAWSTALTAMTASDPERRPTAAECARLLAAAERASRGLPPLAGPAVPGLVVSKPVVAPPAGRARSRRPANGVLLVGVGAAAAALTALVVLNLGEAPAGETPDDRAEPSAGVTSTLVQPVAQVPTTTGDPLPAGGEAVTGNPQAPAGQPTATTTTTITTEDQPDEQDDASEEDAEAKPTKDRTARPGPASPKVPVAPVVPTPGKPTVIDPAEQARTTGSGKG